MRIKLLTGALLAVAPVLTLVYSRAQAPTSPPQTSPQYSQQRLDAIRRSLTAQVAVYDAAEGGVRGPTPEEAAALTLPTVESGTAVQMPNGGMALRQDGSGLSLLVATIGDDGAVRMTHDAPGSKEVSRDR